MTDKKKDIFTEDNVIEEKDLEMVSGGETTPEHSSSLDEGTTEDSPTNYKKRREQN